MAHHDRPIRCAGGLTGQRARRPGRTPRLLVLALARAGNSKPGRFAVRRPFRNAGRLPRAALSRVTLGGIDLRELALADVRSCCAWAPQHPQILGGSLAGNLRLARPDANENDVATALVDIGLGEVLASVGPHGWIGESGERPSAGERVRLALARALLSTAPILLLDGPTVHLDAALAGDVLDRLARQPRAVLLVVHSPEALDERWRGGSGLGTRWIGHPFPTE